MYVEWSIDNMSINSVDYDGSIRLYKLPRNNENTKVSNINENIDILDGLNIQPIYLLTFTGQTLEEASTIINSFIRGINEGKIKIDGYVDYPAQDGLVLENQFPFFYGPSKETYQYTTGSISSSLNDILSIAKSKLLYRKITLSEGYKERGSGLVWSKTPPKLGVLKNTVSETVNKRDYIVSPITYSVMGSDKIYLLSHRSTDKFTIDLKDTLYGIPQSKLATDITEKTNSMVRGEELISFLQLLTRFLVSHVHPFPGVPPVPVSTDGTQTAEILSRLATADNLMLNKNIRIN